MTNRTIALLVLVFASCTGTDIGNPVTELDMALYGDPPAAQIDEAWAVVARVETRRDCAGAPVTELDETVAIDLLATDADPALGDVSRAACGLDLAWGVGGAGAGPEELVGASLVLLGTRGDGTPFVLRSVRSDAVAYDDLALTDDVTSLFVGIDAAALFAAVDLDAATVGADGVIRIEPGSNDALLAAFDAALHGSSHLFDDRDDNGVLDDLEHAPEHQLATGH